VQAYTESAPSAETSQALNPFAVQLARLQQRGLHVLETQSALAQSVPLPHVA
jgi:hypothetical protein